MKREHASVVLVFGGFAVLVLVFRGVWGNAWHALVTGKQTSSSSTKAATPASSSTARAIRLQPGSFDLEFPTPKGTRPGAPPGPAHGPDRHPSIMGSAGDIAGRPGENVFHFTSPDQNKYWAFHHGWAGPGTYQAEKFTDPSHGNTTGTELVRVGP